MLFCTRFPLLNIMVVNAIHILVGGGRSSLLIAGEWSIR